MRNVVKKTEGARRRRWPWALLIVACALLLTDKVIGLANPQPQVGRFDGIEGARAYDSAYAAALAAMPTPTTIRDIPTTFGSVRVTQWTRPELTGLVPVLLTPGWGSGTPAWDANLRDVMAERPVIAVDAVGDAGQSVQRIPLTSTADHARWLTEVLDALEVPRVHVVGHSFGAATATALALHRPERVASLTQLEPVLTYGQLPASVIFWSIPVNVPFLPQSWRDRGLAEIGGVDPTELKTAGPVGEMIAAGTQHYRQAMPMPSPLTDEQIRGLRMPIYLAVAGRKSLVGGDAAVQRARQLLPQGTIRIFPNATHSLPMQESAALDADLLAWWRTQDR
ncbi:alpha/beta hydrolase [Enemella evansiae]|nr:alpha/beta hydrolase [Enemella evansiae]